MTTNRPEPAFGHSSKITISRALGRTRRRRRQLEEHHRWAMERADRPESGTDTIDDLGDLLSG